MTSAAAVWADHLNRAFLERGYCIEYEQKPESFGSWYRDYVRGDRRLRLIWDGRDRWFVLQGGTTWRDLIIQTPSELEQNGIEAFFAHAGEP